MFKHYKLLHNYSIEFVAMEILQQSVTVIITVLLTVFLFLAHVSGQS